MIDGAGNTDRSVMDLLRRCGPMRVADLSAALGVTATAVRQRLNRLMASGMVTRSAVGGRAAEEEAAGGGRGRPSHHYRLTAEGERDTGSNFAELAIALWQEIRQIQDPEVRRGLLERLSKRLASTYAAAIEGESAEERMESLASSLRERDIPFEVGRPSGVADASAEVGKEGGLPVLNALGCPYTGLAEQDRSICAMERMLFSELVGRRLTLSRCRLDGESCCTFEMN